MPDPLETFETGPGGKARTTTAGAAAAGRQTEKKRDVSALYLANLTGVQNLQIDGSPEASSAKADTAQVRMDNRHAVKPENAPAARTITQRPYLSTVLKDLA
ncbi:hypothetical protein [uncultured Devosia sp.]|uniref:hypothetical protein n=1 Tax=uncultured Devosia sp. TaxID=211434 RepID=UPI0035CC6D93